MNKSMSSQELEGIESRVEKLKSNKVSVEDDSIVCPQSEILHLLSIVIERLNSDHVGQAAYDNAVRRLSAIETDIDHIRKDISSLCKVVRDGNGQPSLMHRLTNLESAVAHSRAELTEIKCHANSIIAAKALSKSQVVAGLSGMIITALLSSLALIATLLK